MSARAPIHIVRANLFDDAHGTAVVEQLDAYARSEIALASGLPEEVRRSLIPGLREHPGSMVWLAYHETEAVGVAVCFLGFSTFAARPLMNVHDLAVRASHRRMGVGRSLLAAIETHASANGCCKLTLEVQENNLGARKLYESVGFTGYQLAPDAGCALFWQKPLADRPPS